MLISFQFHFISKEISLSKNHKFEILSKTFHVEEEINKNLFVLVWKKNIRVVFFFFFFVYRKWSFISVFFSFIGLFYGGVILRVVKSHWHTLVRVKWSERNSSWLYTMLQNHFHSYLREIYFCVALVFTMWYRWSIVTIFQASHSLTTCSIEQ